jgi:uncharacterized protein YcsI (UPF0317 family)
MVVPQAQALDFMLFAQRNPKPCPLIEVLDAGQRRAAVRTRRQHRDRHPGYRVYRDGELADERDEIAVALAQRLRAFLIGCSFSSSRR